MAVPGDLAQPAGQAGHADAGGRDAGYVNLGPLQASNVVREITDSETVNVMGYCIGGTLLSMTLALLAARGDRRFGSVTFMV